MIQKQGHWVPYELKPRDVERRFGTCELLLQRQKRKGFLNIAAVMYIRLRCSHECDKDAAARSYAAAKRNSGLSRVSQVSLLQFGIGARLLDTRDETKALANIYFRRDSSETSKAEDINL
ncbi:MOS1T transposase, partial [Pseudoatta argentina]